MFESETILLAEDNPQHVLLIQTAFSEAAPRNSVKVVNDGDEAIRYLKGEGKYADRRQYPYPALLLLDLVMPRVSGFQVLSWARREPDHQRLPIIVLTNSDEIRDVNKAYELGANSFLVKPVNLQDLRNLVHAIEGYLTTQKRVALPQDASGFQPSP